METIPKMEISRNVMLDLLPLYVADEVSEDTRSLFKHYLETDPELSKVIKQLASMEKMEEIPLPLSKDDNLKAIRKAKRTIRLTGIIIGFLLSFALVAITLLIYLNPA